MIASLDSKSFLVDVALRRFISRDIKVFSGDPIFCDCLASTGVIRCIFSCTAQRLLSVVDIKSASGCLLLVPNLIGQAVPLVGLTATSFVVNSTFSILIVLRIRYHQQHIRQSLGTAYGSLYTRIVVICLESCGLIAACSLLTFLLMFTPLPAFQIPLSALPHVCVSTSEFFSQNFI